MHKKFRPPNYTISFHLTSHEFTWMQNAKDPNSVCGFCFWIRISEINETVVNCVCMCLSWTWTNKYFFIGNTPLHLAVMLGHKGKGKQCCNKKLTFSLGVESSFNFLISGQFFLESFSKYNQFEFYY